jgi:hypothetical protein
MSLKRLVRAAHGCLARPKSTSMYAYVHIWRNYGIFHKTTRYIVVRNSLTIPLGIIRARAHETLHLIAWCFKPGGFHRGLKLSTQVHLDQTDLHGGSTNATHEFNIPRKVYFTDYWIHQTRTTYRVYPQWMRSSQVWMRSSQVWMRSSQVVRASGCQCQSRYSAGLDPSILRHSGI